MISLGIGQNCKNNHFSKAFINAIGDQLEALNTKPTDLDTSQCKWTKLQESILWNSTKATLDGILSTATHLRTTMIRNTDWTKVKDWRENMLQHQKWLSL